MVALFGAALPVTPDKSTRDKIEIEKVIRKLNSEYGIGIQIPDPTLSPNDRQKLGAQNEQFARSDRIHRGIQFLYYQRGDVLEQALCSFFSEAKAASRRWAPKPRANPGTFPSTFPSACTPPKVQTADQQENLQNILIKVINDYKARMTPSLRLPKPSGAAVVARPGDEPDASPPKSVSESPSSASSKRSFDRDDDHEFKRLRAQEFSALRYPSPASINALDKVPSRRRLGGARTNWSPERRRVDEEPGSFSIAASSSSNVSSLFSHSEGQQLSQTTLDEDVHEKRLLATRGLAFSPPLHCDLPRRSAPQASAFEELGDPVQHRSQRSSTSSGDGSGFAGSSNASLGKTLETPRNRGNRLSEASKPSAIHSRLQNIWRE
ncbi:hypothetical protein VTG60DRAFT_4502 [Thermothelomyces hinnuleus]